MRDKTEDFIEEAEKFKEEPATCEKSLGSGEWAAVISRPWRPSDASSVSYPSALIMLAKRLRVNDESSMIRINAIIHPPFWTMKPVTNPYRVPPRRERIRRARLKDNLKYVP